ncbi:MAG TPA: hypothetical protein VN426_06080 [Syntrophomonadaceae bacterium]|nr:hypothetical protein [Syntrophomonadaceae bacterium]
MSGSTSRMGLPYPSGNESTDVVRDIKALAEAVDNRAVWLGIDNKSTQQSKTLVIDTDTRSISATRIDGKISGITIKDPSDNSVVENITVNRTDGIIASIVKAAGGKTITYTPIRADGLITGITKGVA